MIAPRSVLLVHTSFKAVGEGTPQDVIASLRSALGPDGTLVMPALSDDDEQVFDAKKTPCRGMGIVADSFWRLPGVERSDNPASFAAAGPLGRASTAPHDSSGRSHRARSLSHPQALPDLAARRPHARGI